MFVRGPSLSNSSLMPEQRSHDASFWIGIARGFGGAFLFSLPILMTMEM